MRVPASTPTSTRVRSWVRCRRSRSLAGGDRPGSPLPSGPLRRRLCFTESLGAGLLRPRGRGQAQAVAGAALGVDQVSSVLGELAPQVGDVGGHDAVGTAEVVI